jgi:hypothetical protein
MPSGVALELSIVGFEGVIGKKAVFRHGSFLTRRERLSAGAAKFYFA